jgi:predicted DCC family thiol-disulfide oxidoreductase YuxK
VSRSKIKFEHHEFFKAPEMTRDDFGSNAETAYFDGQCPLCTREIQFYRRQRGAENVNWIDVTKVDLLDLPFGLTQEDALARFHIVNFKGQLVSGGEAFSALWLSLPAFRWAGKFFQINFFASLLETMYKIFLPCRPLLQRYMPKLPNQLDKDPQDCETDR